MLQKKFPLNNNSQINSIVSNSSKNFNNMKNIWPANISRLALIYTLGNKRNTKIKIWFVHQLGPKTKIQRTGQNNL